MIIPKIQKMTRKMKMKRKRRMKITLWISTNIMLDRKDNLTSS